MKPTTKISLGALLVTSALACQPYEQPIPASPPPIAAAKEPAASSGQPEPTSPPKTNIAPAPAAAPRGPAPPQ